MMSYAEKEDGWIRLPPSFLRLYSALNLNGYVQLYDDERKIATALVLAAVGDDDFNETCEQINRTEPAQLVEDVQEVLEAIDGLPEEIFRLPRTDAEWEAAANAFQQLAPEEQAKLRKRQQLFFGALLACFFQQLSLMVHGEKLTALVQQAISGNDAAFAKAIQIDRNLLAGHKAFHDRMARAQLLGESDFLDAVAYRMRNPVAKGKIRYRELWFALSILDGFEMLAGMTRRELLDLLEAAGLDLRKNGVEDEGYLAKRIKQYREFQNRRVIATP